MRKKMKQTLMGKFTDLSNIMSDKVAAGSCNISQVATLVDSMVKIYKAVNEENKDGKQEFKKSLKKYINKQSAI